VVVIVVVVVVIVTVAMVMQLEAGDLQQRAVVRLARGVVDGTVLDADQRLLTGGEEDEPGRLR
jgi:hypothetical protein